MASQIVNQESIEICFAYVAIRANADGYWLDKLQPFTKDGNYKITSIEEEDRNWSKNFQTLQEVADWLNDPGEF